MTGMRVKVTKERDVDKDGARHDGLTSKASQHHAPPLLYPNAQLGLFPLLYSNAFFEKIMLHVVIVPET
jgi:hypothetical protein